MDHSIWLLMGASVSSFALGCVFIHDRATENYDAATRAYSNLCDAKDQVIESQKAKNLAMEELNKSQNELLEIQDKLILALTEERDSLKELYKSQLELDEAQKNLIKSLSKRNTEGSS
jgi:hypothetical protein